MAGEVIVSWRKAMGLVQMDVALRAGIDQTHLCRIEKGERRASLGTLARVANALGLDPNQRLRLLLARAAEEGYVVGGGL